MKKQMSRLQLLIAGQMGALFLILKLAAFTTVVHATEEWEAPSILFQDLVFDSDASRASLRGALSTYGLIAVTGIPDYDSARVNVLSGVIDCDNFEESGTLPDGSTRQAIASATSFLTPNPLESSCSALSEAAPEFRRLVGEVSGAMVAALDRELGAFDIPRTFGSAPYSSFADIREHGQQLEHFVKYTNSEEESESYALPLHTDDGLLIAMTPALSASGKSGLVVQLPGGDKAMVKFPSEASVVFMVGAGFNKWVAGGRPVLRAVPHAMQMQASDAQRAWYGRMFLPPKDAQSEGISFQTFRQLHLNASVSNRQNNGAGCLSGSDSDKKKQNFKQLMETVDCSGDEFHCWMKCYGPDDPALPPCDALEDYRCLSNSDGETECDPETMGCGPVCFNRTIPDDQFCDPYSAVSMYMTGFQSPGNAKASCVVFLFQGYVLDTKGKYIASLFFAFVLGAFLELVIKLRRKARKNVWKSKAAANCTELLLFGTQASMGYVLMLLAMTYSVPMFLCVVAGLVCGHFALNMDMAVSDGATPCCEGADYEDTGNTPYMQIKNNAIKEPLTLNGGGNGGVSSDDEDYGDCCAGK